jgi:integrase/recombinase XerC
VDLDRGEAWFKTAKGNRPERVILGRKIHDHLREYVADRFPGPLFTDRAGHRLTTRHVQRRFAQWLKKAGVDRPASLHSLRHAFAYQIYHQTHDLLLTKAALRHRSIMSTLVYAQVDEERLRRVLQG